MFDHAIDYVQRHAGEMGAGIISALVLVVITVVLLSFLDGAEQRRRRPRPSRQARQRTNQGSRKPEEGQR